uniref:Uncharacterized protein n=1 Tax=Eimeria tenella TaxID=5802 RepID=H9B959_EIMTE|nr:hypothetical protein [Eimeria tenella]
MLYSLKRAPSRGRQRYSIASRYELEPRAQKTALRMPSHLVLTAAM